MKLKKCSCTDDQDHYSSRDREQYAAARIDFEIKTVLEHFYRRPERRAAFELLVMCVRRRTGLLHPTPGHGRPGWVAPVFLINRLRGLAERHNQWLRQCEDWHPSGGNLRPEFRSLVWHLLAFYPIPGFMDSVWDLPSGPESFCRQAAYIRLARGASFRDLNLPLLLTRKMEHYVRQAPDHYTFEQALRYGEVLGSGGSEKLACQIALGTLGRKIQQAEFWRTVILFFVNHPEMDLALGNPIIDFIQANKFAGEEILTENGAGYRQPLWPDFSMKGRTLSSMMRLLRDWNLNLNERKPSQSFSWPASTIPGFRFAESSQETGEQREWSIHELVSSAELYAEGRALRHCVYTYAFKCREGKTTLWSLRLRVNGIEKRMATIEADLGKRAIIQTRAKCNRYAGVRSREMIRQWAAATGLKVECGSW